MPYRYYITGSRTINNCPDMHIIIILDDPATRKEKPEIFMLFVSMIYEL